MSDVPRDIRLHALRRRAHGIVWLRSALRRCSAGTRCRGCCCCSPTTSCSSLIELVPFVGPYRAPCAEAGVRRRLPRRRLDPGARRHARARSICSRASAPICGRCCRSASFFSSASRSRCSRRRWSTAASCSTSWSAPAARSGRGRSCITDARRAARAARHAVRRAVRAADRARAVVGAGAGGVPGCQRRRPRWRPACAPRSRTGGRSSSTRSRVFFYARSCCRLSAACSSRCSCRRRRCASAHRAAAALYRVLRRQRCRSPTT